MWKPYTDTQIYEYFLGEPLYIGKRYKSVFRDDGQMPALAFMEKHGSVYWHDFGGLVLNPNIGKKDAVGFVVQKFDLNSRNEGENFILNEILPQISKSPWVSNPNRQIKPTLKAQPKLQIRGNYKTYEWDWWSFIDRRLLKTYMIYPCHSLVYTKGDHVGSDLGSSESSPAFCYIYDMNKESWKCYRPKESGLNKWKSNNLKGVIEGYNQLPLTADRLIITSSTKDILTIRTYLNEWAIAPTGETAWGAILGKARELNARFKTIIIWLDADYTGNLQTRLLKNKTNWGTIMPPLWFKDNKIKDQTDMVLNGSPLFFQEFYKNNICSQ